MRQKSLQKANSNEKEVIEVWADWLVYGVLAMAFYIVGLYAIWYFYERHTKELEKAEIKEAMSRLTSVKGK